MARPTRAVTAAVAVCGILAALSGVTAATTVVSFGIFDPPPGAPGLSSDGKGAYEDFRIAPNNPVNWCVDAAPYSGQGLLFVRLNRKLDGDAGVLRCSDNVFPYPTGSTPADPRNVTLTIGDVAACNQLADPDAGLPVTDAANIPWTIGLSNGPCILATNHNPRIRLDTLYKARAKSTPVAFQTEMFGYPVSYVIQSDGAATITPVGETGRAVTYASTFHLVKYAPGTKPKNVGPAFRMPVQMTFTTTTVP